MKIIPFKADHALALDLQEAQIGEAALFTAENLASLEVRNSYSVEHEGKLLCCFGWVVPHKGRALLWCVFDKNAGRHMVVLHRIAKEVIRMIPHRRVEAEVAANFPSGIRWMEMLGLKCETPTPLKAYRVDGGDAYIFAKVN